MPQPHKVLFLPGAGGSAQFWRPLAGQLVHRAEQQLFGWPGFGPLPRDPAIGSVDDLLAMVVAQIDRPVALIAQSMGGVIAIQAALARPDRVTHLVLTATSGGIDISDLNVQDWRPAYLAGQPAVPRWFVDYRADLSAELHALHMPALLLWGDADPISPVSVGKRLQQRLPNARMQVIAGGEHDLANKLAGDIAPLIDTHLCEPAAY